MDTRAHQDLTWISVQQGLEYLKDKPGPQRLLEAWLDWSSEGELPSMYDVRPEMIGRHLPSVSLFDLSSDTPLEYRLTGGLHRGLADKELRSSSLLDLTPPQDHPELLKRARLVCGVPCGIISTGHFVHASGTTSGVVSVGFPLCSQRNGTVDRAILSIHSEYQPEEFSPDPVVSIPVPTDPMFIDLQPILSP